MSGHAPQSGGQDNDFREERQTTKLPYGVRAHFYTLSADFVCALCEAAFHLESLLVALLHTREPLRRISG